MAAINIKDKSKIYLLFLLKLFIDLFYVIKYFQNVHVNMTNLLWLVVLTRYWMQSNVIAKSWKFGVAKFYRFQIFIPMNLALSQIKWNTNSNRLQKGVLQSTIIVHCRVCINPSIVMSDSWNNFWAGNEVLLCLILSIWSHTFCEC